MNPVKRLVAGLNDFLGTTTCINEAAATSKRRTLPRILLVFLAVYGIGILLTNLVLSTVSAYDMMSNPEVMHLIESGETDVDKIYAVYESGMSDWLRPMSLVATVGMILSVVYYCTRMERRRLFTLGFVKKNAAPEYLVGAAVGVALFALAFGIICLFGGGEFVGLNPDLSLPMLLFYFIGFLLQGLSEELLLRGYLFVTVSARTDTSLGVLVSSLAFALLHLGNSGVNALSLLNLFLFGVLTCLYFLRRGNIWGAAALHSLWNFAQGNLFSARVSGNTEMPSLFNATYGENMLLNGGTFGPEGGLAVTAVLVCGIAILCFMNNKETNSPDLIDMNRFFGF